MMRKTLTIHNKTIDAELRDELIPYVNEVFLKNGSFRKSKPKKASGDSKYVWRMIAFFVGTRPEMPVTADFDLDDEWWPKPSNLDRGYRNEIGNRRREHTKELDGIVDEILKLFPRTTERGTMRWGRAMGVL